MKNNNYRFLIGPLASFIAIKDIEFAKSYMEGNGGCAHDKPK